MRSQYEWSDHEPLGLKVGLEVEIIDLVKRRADLDTVGAVAGLGDRERLVIHFVRELISEEKVSSATFGQAREWFGERGAMDLTGLVGYYDFVNLTLKTFDVQLAPSQTRSLPDLW